MPRPNRQISATGYYHIIIRGVGKQILFEETGDNVKFLHILRENLPAFQITCAAYCLMDNHVHLLLHDPGSHLPRFMQTVSSAYARFFNFKYERSGHLFQGRYFSVAIESELQLLAVFRYILQNPERAGMGAAYSYKWSSYRDYGKKGGIADTAAIAELLGDVSSYRLFIQEECAGEEHVHYKDEGEMPGAHTNTVFREVLGTTDGTVLQRWNRPDRNKAVRALKRKGLSIRTIERRTGISRGIIQNIKT